MSHFSVLVVGPDIEGQLAPFQENNMGDCPKEYLKFVDQENEHFKEYSKDFVVKVMMPDGRMLNTWDEEFRVSGIGIGNDTHKVPSNLKVKKVKFNKLYATFEDYMKDWCGYKERDAEMGKYGYWENPNKRWDWYKIGGRWTGYFKLKDGAVGLAGSPGLMTPEAKPGYVDQARVDAIDFSGMIEEAREKAKQDYEKVESLFGGSIPKLDVTWSELQKSRKYKLLTTDEKRWLYHGQPAMQKKEQIVKSLDRGSEDCSLMTWLDLDNYQVSKEQFMKDAGEDCLSTFAVIKDGKWYEKGEMGWWGVVSNAKEKKKWNKEFAKLVLGLPGDTLLTVVDCHI